MKLLETAVLKTTEKQLFLNKWVWSMLVIPALGEWRWEILLRLTASQLLWRAPDLLSKADVLGWQRGKVRCRVGVTHAFNTDPSSWDWPDTVWIAVLLSCYFCT
ncbi:hypothetical protein LEMLEM_LOCUS7091, partial [Lemmus lemmus]